MIVNNDTPKETYHDYSNLVGTMKAGVTSSVAITYATGYTYGTIIWVDWNNNLTLEDDEIMYKGQSASSNPTTLNASIHISATQAIGDYRMRIGGADSDFDAYIAGTSTESPDPCYAGTWACFQDYTIRVTEAPECLAPDNLTATEDQAYSSVLNWTSHSSETFWKVYYKKVSETSYTEVDVTEVPYTLENLTAATNTNTMLWPTVLQREASLQRCAHSAPTALLTCQFLTLRTSTTIQWYQTLYHQPVCYLIVGSISTPAPIKTTWYIHL